jgi:hypothetical protein
MVLDVKNFCCGTPMERYKHMKSSIKLIPQEIIDQHNLLDLVVNGRICIESRKGMPGLKQAGRIANDRRQKHQAKFGHSPIPCTPSLWQHNSRPVTFSLVVDDFGIKHVGQAHADHLIHALQQLYQISIDWTGLAAVALDSGSSGTGNDAPFASPCPATFVLHSTSSNTNGMGIAKMLHTHGTNQSTYGAMVQHADHPNDSLPLDAKSITLVQKIAGTFICHAMVVDCTMLVALGSIASTQSKATKNTFNKVTWLLNCAASNPDAKSMHTASDMVLHVHSNGSHLSKPKACSRAGGHFFFSDLSCSPNEQPKTTPTPNGPICSLLRIIRNVMGSAAEAEIASSYMNGQEAIPIRTTLNEMGHPQPPTPVQVDNSTAEGFANNTIKQKRSKAIDMHFCWIQDPTRQGQFVICWRPGTDNLGDCHTKHHSATHHHQVRPNCLHPSEQSTEQLANNVIHLLLQGCVNSRGTHSTHDLEEAQNPFTTLSDKRRAPFNTLRCPSNNKSDNNNLQRPSSHQFSNEVFDIFCCQHLRFAPSMSSLTRRAKPHHAFASSMLCMAS